jgi:hypothetical protein
MAINVSFNGATIFKPGSYSRTNIDLGGGFPLGPAGLIAVIGEADAGTPGAQEVNIADNHFGADQISVIRDKYRSGPIADSAAMLFSPAADAAIPSGAQTVWFYKTNASVRADLTLANTYGDVVAREWGVGGNRLSLTNTLIAETPATTASSSAFNETTIATGSQFSAYVNGGAIHTWTAPAIADNAALAASLANAGDWTGGLPTGLTITVGGVDGASTVTMTMVAAATQYQLGWGRSFELAAGTPTDALATMNLTAGLKLPAVEPSATLKLDQKRDNIQEESAVGGHIALTLGHDGSGGVTTATVTIDDTNIILNQNGTPVFTLPKSSYVTLLDLASELNLPSYGGWSAAVGNTAYNQLPIDVLDHVSTVGALSPANMPARIKKDASQVQDFFDLSTLAQLDSPASVGLPAALVETLLTGGARGATAPADIVAALAKFEKFHVNAVVPLFSRDATDDISDSLTDSGSTYTIAGIHQAVKTHISLMKTTKRRSERQGYLSMKASYAACSAQAGVLADGRLQLAIQDTRNTDVLGNIKWFQPWSLAAMLAGARGGAPIGEPLTFKFLNCAGIRQTAQPMSTPDANIVIDFDPDLQADDAIQAGITFLEAPQTGGFRVVVDNTTYGRDDNFVFNRGNVLYAADIVAFNFRNALENVFVGRKNTITPADVAGVAASTLGTFLAQGITVATADAPQGYKSLIVRIEGNTIFVEVTIKLVEGIDFVLSDITIQRASQG